jgi:hypothetical protein
LIYDPTAEKKPMMWPRRAGGEAQRLNSINKYEIVSSALITDDFHVFIFMIFQVHANLIQFSFVLLLHAKKQSVFLGTVLETA